MIFPSIDIQGSILSADLLAKIRSEQASFQQGKDFNADYTNAKLKDEISLAWQEAKGQWTIFKSKLARLKDGETGTNETRNFWISPLLTNLGYNLTFNRQSEELNGKSFPIWCRDSSLNNFPLYVGGYNESLDKRPERKQLRVSPHAMLQEYLNYSEHLYGLVTNGRQLRLLRDASRITRLSYVEFNLEKMMEEDLYSDFVILYRVLHASRMPKTLDAGAESIIEKYHQEGLAAGSTIRSKLGDAVKEAILRLSNGFINHPNNTTLLEAVASGNFNADEYYRHQLRIIYRLLFLFVIEERNLVYAENKTPEAKRFHHIYFSYYSLLRLRKLAKKLLPPEADRHYDLWQGLLSTFSLFEKKDMGEKLGIMALQGDLFGIHAISGNGYDLHQCYLSNAVLLNIFRSLSYFENENGVLIAVNYGGLDVEEFGSVYEGLLELKLEVKKIEGSDQYSCLFDTSNERGKSGSHYTPEELVQPLIKHSLEYLIQDRVDSGQWVVVRSAVDSGQWGVDRNSVGSGQNVSNKYLKIAPYETIKKLSGVNSLAEINGLSKNDLLFYKILSERRDVWIDFANQKGGNQYSGQYSGGAGKEHHGGVSSVSGDSQRFFSGVRDFNDTLKGLGLSDERAIRNAVKSIRGNNQALERINQCIKEITTHYPLSTTHCTLSKQPMIDGLLSLKIADVACGSGHILLSAARRLALEIARVQTEEEQPNPLAIRKAMKDVVRNCIYGVDKNPLAVELCKIALWLEAYNPGEPLNFLDHHIKCGDAIVGLAHRSELENGIADEAFKTLPGDDKDIAASFRKRNQQERKQKDQASLDFEASINEEINAVIEKFNLFKNLPETTPDEVAKKEKEYHNFEKSVERIRLQQLADAQVAQFFIPKTDANKPYLLTDAEYRSFLRNVHKGIGPLQSQKLSYVETLLPYYRFFHWFIEFPEVFSGGGFDCVLGNPPFLGGQKLSGSFGDAFLESIKYRFAPIGAVDLVTYFFRRIFTIIKKGGFQSLISTNTIAQGKAREDGLDIIVKNGGSINFAIKSTKWPGIAAVEVALVTITKQPWKGKYYLGTKEVKTITPYLDDAETLGNPYPLKQNEGKSFQGSIVLGKGFVLEPGEAQALIAKDPRNKDVLFPYLNGDDLNNNPDQSPSRWVINFFDWPEEKAKTYPNCYEIVERLVKPERQRWAIDKSGNEIKGEYALRKPLPEKWWIYGEKRPALYQTIAPLERVMVITRVSKYVVITYVESSIVFMDKVVILIFDENKFLALLQCSQYDVWVWKYSSTLGSNTINFAPNDCFGNFPFPQNLSPQQEQQLESLGDAYHEHRRQLMLGLQLGLTRTYNLFHDPLVDRNIVDSGEWTVDRKNLPTKNLETLKKHLEKTPGTISLQEAIQGILKLRELHVQMDEAVLEAYGWSDIQLRHDFYEVDYLPENDRIRYTIHPDARKEVLKRLLHLNHKIHEEEVKAGLWEKKKTNAKKSKPISKSGGRDLFNQE